MTTTDRAPSDKEYMAAYDNAQAQRALADLARMREANKAYRALRKAHKALAR